jgi:TatD DNase family protein
MIDVHCHLNFHAFEKDSDALIHKADTDGVKIIINVGTKIDSSQKAVALAKNYTNVYAIVGIHPHHADKHTLDSNWLQELEALTKEKKVVGIGEIGLDYYQYKSNGIVDPKLQKKFFEQQIILASKVKLPIQIHNRHAGSDVIEILKHHKNLLQNPPGMFHCFSGNMHILQEVLDLGFYIGFDGNITYKGLAPGETVSLTDLARKTPLERIVTETDAPFLTPEPFRGSRNIPSHVILVGEALSKIKNIPFEKFQKITEENAKTLFDL